MLYAFTTTASATILRAGGIQKLMKSDVHFFEEKGSRGKPGLKARVLVPTTKNSTARS